MSPSDDPNKGSHARGGRGGRRGRGRGRGGYSGRGGGRGNVHDRSLEREQSSRSDGTTGGHSGRGGEQEGRGGYRGSRGGGRGGHEEQRGRGRGGHRGGRGGGRGNGHHGTRGSSGSTTSSRDPEIMSHSSQQSVDQKTPLMSQESQPSPMMQQSGPPQEIRYPPLMQPSGPPLRHYGPIPGQYQTSPGQFEHHQGQFRPPPPPQGPIRYQQYPFSPPPSQVGPPYPRGPPGTGNTWSGQMSYPPPLSHFQLPPETVVLPQHPGGRATAQVPSQPQAPLGVVSPMQNQQFRDQGSVNESARSTREGGQKLDSRKTKARNKQRGHGLTARRKRSSIDQESTGDECESLVASDDDVYGSIPGDQLDDIESELTPKEEDELSETERTTSAMDKYPDLQLATVKAWLNKSSADIVSDLMQMKGSLQKLLSQRELCKGMLTYLIPSLATAFEEKGSDVQELANTILKKTRFLKLHLPQYILHARINSSGDEPAKVLEGMVAVMAILEKFLLAAKSKQATEILPSLVLVGDVFRDMETKKIEVPATAKASLQNCLDKHNALTPEAGAKAKTNKNKQSADEPVTEFPSVDEIRGGEPPDFPALAEKYKYTTTEECVKIQFQLLRELIAEPIRRRVTAYQELHDENKMNEASMSKIPVYQHVTVRNIVYSKESGVGLLYRLHFDTAHLQHIHWEANTHLAEGSVVCLSFDHFETLIYGIVHGRRPDELRQGFVELQIPRAEDVVSLLSNSVFYMIDSLETAEGVLDILSTLQYLTDVTMPFLQHVITMSNPKEKVFFCRDDTECFYDLSSLVSDDIRHKEAKAMANNVPLANYEAWPTTESTSLDDLQMQAVKAALTQEVTAIRGLPGTGKTYVALKIAEVLVRNRHKWSVNLADKAHQRTDVDSGPILIISPDEFSLDHFLGNILSFQDKGVIRLAQPSNDPKVAKLSAGKKLRNSTSRGTSAVTEEEEEIQKKLSVIHDNIHIARRTIVSLDSLKYVMSPSQVENISEKGGMMTWIMPDSIPKTSKRVNVGKSLQQGDAWVEYPFHIDYDPEKKPPITDTGESKQKKQLMARLRHTNVMKKQQVDEIDDLWSLSNDQRWRLYRFWMKEFKQAAIRRIQLIYKGFDSTLQQEKAKSEKADYDQFRGATVLGVTSSSAIQYHRVLRYLQPRIVLINDAADVMEAVVIASLTQNCRQLIMIGDSKATLQQKPPVSHILEMNDAEPSLFRRLIEKQYGVISLSTQHRMKPEISKFIKVEHPDLQDHADVTRYDSIKGVSRSVYFLGHDVSLGGTSTHEVAFLTALSRYLIGQGHVASEISVLANSRGQYDRLRKKFDEEVLKSVNIHLVDHFLGESDIVLLATFQMHKQIGRLKPQERLTRALSRARKGFYAVGNFEFVTERNDHWISLIEIAKRMESMGHELPLSCRNHPDQHDVASTAEDIMKRIQTGGCSRLCMARLKCGHSCKLPCHKHDNKQMGNYRCEQPCQKPICPAGHRCTKSCFEKCDKKCNRDSERKLQCGHTQLAPCALKLDEIKCNVVCAKILPCGHPCRNTCGEPCVTECMERVTREDWPCQHVVEVCCSDTMDMCPNLCDGELKCGHRCQGTCGSCMRGRVHVICEKPCGRILVCGHQCKSKCSTTCPPCTSDCQNKCKHSRCTETCGESCFPCQEHCEWQCPHQVCRQVCSQPCDREPCRQPCKKDLKCGHECIGLCGEPCPKKCRVCHQEDVTTLFFGREDEPDARFVELEDCGHVIEVDALDKWMTPSADKAESETILLKGCPKCKTPIRKNLRYGNVIKRILADIEAVKKKMMGSSIELKENKRLLKKKVGVLEKLNTGSISEEIAERFRKDLSNCRHLETVVARLNRCNFLQEVINLQTQVDGLRQFLEDESAGKKLPKAHRDILEYRLKPMYGRLDGMRERVFVGDFDRFSDQQMDDTLTEVIRLGMECDVASLLVKNMPWWDKNTTDQYLIIGFDEIMANQKPLSTEQEEEAKGVLSRIRIALGISEGPTLGISDRERLQVVHAIGLSQGHWFKCKEGHIYAIGECGGAMEHGRCPECGSTIGGQRHRLTDENLLAGEMDRAQHAAWSKEANAAQQ